MTKTIICLFISMTLLSFRTGEQKINFYEGSYDELIEHAKQQNKPYFIEFYTDWCAPCKRMERETFRSTRVASYVNQNYIAYRMDGDRFSTMDVAEKYDVQGFPTVLFFDSNSYPIGEITGFRDAGQFLVELRKTSNQSF